MLIVFYDGWCPLCTAIARRTQKLDRAGKVTFVSFREESVITEYSLSRELQERMNARMFAYDGKWHEGIHAVAALARRIPAYRVLVPLVQLSIWTGTGRYVYDWVAKRRNIIPIGHCEDGACRIHGNNMKS